MEKSNINHLKITPPTGWISCWESHRTNATEIELLSNAKYAAEHLKQYGWEYIVCDVQWYIPHANKSWCHKYADLCMDEYARLIPAKNRFPSSEGGLGFTRIASRIHKMGLKFGIHIRRGIPKKAVLLDSMIKGTTATARDVAYTFLATSWNTDMCGVDATRQGAQEYYNSLFELYASWGVDYVRVEDETGYEAYNSHLIKLEIEMMKKAIEHCGRPIVLSISPVNQFVYHNLI